MHHVVYELQHQSQESQNQIIIPPGTPPKLGPQKLKKTVVSLILNFIFCCALLQALDVALHASCSAISRIANSFVAKWPLYRGGRDGEKGGDQRSSLSLMFASKIRSLTKRAFYVFTFSRRNRQVLTQRNTLFRCKTTLQPSVCFRDPL